ncbi:MAG: hypothetical protein M1834_007594 [Cirrosporium novae-zelandiae]|nr:MAG: hypothetical protein M1834_007594 [Cirrosporium novae-zelandiae]
MSLRTGTELITLTLFLNKVSGFYGLLALLTGYHLSMTQLSMYIYSLGALVLAFILAPHIRKASLLPNLVLAHFYTLDTLINASYTIVFATTWFLVLANPSNPTGPGASTIDATSGFTSPANNFTHVSVTASPADGTTGSQDAVAVGITANSSPSLVAGGPPAEVVLHPESLSSVLIITSLSLVRVYFCLVVLAYARSVLRTHISLSAIRNYGYNHTYTSPFSGVSTTTSVGGTPIAASTDAQLNPFIVDPEYSFGWGGALGRFLISLAPSYWLGAEDEADDINPDQSLGWMKFASVSRRGRNNGGFRSLVPSVGSAWEMGFGGRPSGEEGGVKERERRRRSGTGPPGLPVGLKDVVVAEPVRTSISIAPSRSASRNGDESERV